MGRNHRTPRASGALSILVSAVGVIPHASWSVASRTVKAPSGTLSLNGPRARVHGAAGGFATSYLRSWSASSITAGRSIALIEPEFMAFQWVRKYPTNGQRLPGRRDRIPTKARAKEVSLSLVARCAEGIWPAIGQLL
jgi:hypothetical protein